MRASVVAGASSGGASGGIQSTYEYMTSPGPHTVQGGVKATGVGIISGAALGSAGAVASGVTRKAAGDAARYGGQTILRSRTFNSDAGTMALGRMMDERVIPYADNNGYGYYKALPNWMYDTGEKLLAGNCNTRFHMWVDQQWITYQKGLGKNFKDIGAPADDLRPSDKDPPTGQPLL